MDAKNGRGKWCRLFVNVLNMLCSMWFVFITTVYATSIPNIKLSILRLQLIDPQRSHNYENVLEQEQVALMSKPISLGYIREVSLVWLDKLS